RLKVSCRSSIWWPIASMGIAPRFWTLSMRVSGSRRSWRSRSETRCWLQRPRTADKRYRYKGEARAQRVVVAPDSAPSMVATVAARLPASSWYRRKVSEGTKGPIVYELARQRVTLCKEGLPDRTVWLVIKRTLGAAPSYT